MARLYNPMARILDFESKIRVFFSLHFDLYASFFPYLCTAFLNLALWKFWICTTKT